MRFRVIDIFILVLVLLLIIAVSALCIGTAMGLIPGEALRYGIEVITNGLIVNRLILGAIGLVLLIFVFTLFIAMFRRKTAKAKPVTTALISATDNGSAYITVAALDALVQRHCRANPKVKDCESRVVALDGSIAVELKLQLMPETVMPELTAQLQASLKEYVEHISGITVSAVEVTIQPAAAQKLPKSV